MPLQAVLADFEDLLSVNDDRDVKLLADALRLSSSVLNRYPDMLGPQVILVLLTSFFTWPDLNLFLTEQNKLC